MAAVRLLAAAAVLAAAGAATVEKYVYEVDDAVIIEAAGPDESPRTKRQEGRWGFNLAQTVIPPGWPGLPAGVTDDCNTPDGRSGLCVARTICYWTRNLPPDSAMERSLGECAPATGRASLYLSRPSTRAVCCPGLFGGSTRPVAATTTPRPPPAATNWWQTTTPRTTTRRSTTRRSTTRRSTTRRSTTRRSTTTRRTSPAVPQVTQWWQTTEDPDRIAVTETTPKPTTSATTTTKPTKPVTTTKKPVTTTKKPTTTKRTTTRRPTTTRKPTKPSTTTRRPVPSIPTIPPIITHPWQATSTSPRPQQTTVWWQTTSSSAAISTASSPVTQPPTPSTTGWWDTTVSTTTTRRPTRPTSIWWKPSKAPSTGSKAESSTPGAVEESGEDYSECGTRNLEADRIVGGEEAAQGEFPWIAAIFKGSLQFCGGSLIDRTHILTAAHCVAHMSPYDVRRLKVRLGDHNIRTDKEADHEEFDVKRVVRHKGFSESTLHTDIALLTLKKPVTYKDHIRPVCMATGERRYTNESATVAGWGTLSEAGRQPSKLQKVSLTVWENERCADSYGDSAPGGIIRSMLCAGSPGKDSCSGDSGGPLMWVGESNKVTQIGVVSWGIGCAKIQYPGVYTRVNDLLTWIDRNREAF